MPKAIHKQMQNRAGVKYILCRTDVWLRTYWFVNLKSSYLWKNVTCKKCLKKRHSKK